MPSALVCIDYLTANSPNPKHKGHVLHVAKATKLNIALIRSLLLNKLTVANNFNGSCTNTPILIRA